MEILWIPILIGLFLLTTSRRPAHAGGFIIPGKKAGDIELGQPLSPLLFQSLGQPTSYNPPEPGEGGIDTGCYFWENKLMIKLNDGKGDMNIYQILVWDSSFVSDRGIRPGDPFDRVEKVYPNGTREETMDMDFSWQLPGITFYIYDDKVVSIGVHE